MITACVWSDHRCGLSSPSLNQLEVYDSGDVTNKTDIFDNRDRGRARTSSSKDVPQSLVWFWGNVPQKGIYM